MKHSDNVDFYNILFPHYPDGRLLRRIEQLAYRVPQDLGMWLGAIHNELNLKFLLRTRFESVQ